MAAIIGTVGQVIGVVQAVDATGATRVLAVGDVVYAGETILTGEEGYVAINLIDGHLFDLGRNGQAELDSDLIAVDEDTSLFAASDEAALSIEAIQAAIAAGIDPTQLVPAPAAGPAAGAPGFGPDGSGHSFVSLNPVLTDVVIGVPEFETEGFGQDFALAFADVPFGPGSEPVAEIPSEVIQRTVTVDLSASTGVEEGVVADYTFTATLSDASQGVTTITTDQGVITIGDGETSGTLVIASENVEDVYKDGSELTATITKADGGNFETLVVGDDTATAKVEDTTTDATVDLSASTVLESDGVANYTFTATLSDASEGTTTITTDKGVIEITDGNTEGTLVIASENVEDVYKDGSELTAKITGTSGGNFENLVVGDDTATAKVEDTTTDATVDLTASTESEGESVDFTFTATLSHASEGTTTITTDQGDITITDGNTEGTLVIASENVEDVYKDGSELTAKITGTSGGNFENLVVGDDTATAKVDDTKTDATVTLGDVTVIGNTATIDATLSHAVTENALVLTLSNDATITIGVGEITGTSTSFDLVDGASLTVSIDDTKTTGGNFENLMQTDSDSIPGIGATGTSVDETGGIGNANATANGDLIAAFGADIPGTVELSATDATWNGTDRLTADDGSWQIKVNGDGTYTVTQLKVMDHPDDDDPDDAITVTVTATATDADGDAVATTFDVSFLDDGPSINPDAADVSTFNTTATAALNSSYGTDGPGGIVFTGTNGALLQDTASNNVIATIDGVDYEVSLSGFGTGTLTGTLDGVGDAAQAMDGEPAFTIVMNPESGEYTVNFNEIGLTTSFDQFPNAGAKAWAGLDADSSGGKKLLDISVDDNGSNDLLITAFSGDKNVVNSNEHSLGADNPFVDAGEYVRVDMVVDVDRINQAPNEGESTSGGFTYDQHYEVSSFSFSIGSSDNVSVIKVTAGDFDDDRASSKQALDANTDQVALNPDNVIITDAAGSIVDASLYNVDVDADGSLYIDSMLDGYTIHVFSVDGEAFDNVTIYNADGMTLGDTNFYGGNFSLTGFEPAPPLGEEIALSFDVEITDRDLDSVDATLSVNMDDLLGFTTDGSV